MIMFDSCDSPIFSSHEQALLGMLGYLQLRHGSPEKAAAFFDALAMDNPADRQIALSHACSLIRCGHASEALTVLEPLGDSGELSSLAWLLRGQALSQLGRVAEAARAMRMFIRQRHADERWRKT